MNSASTNNRRESPQMFSKTHGETQDNFAFHRLGDKLTTAWGKVAHAKQRNRDGLNNRLGCFLPQYSAL